MRASIDRFTTGCYTLEMNGGEQRRQNYWEAGCCGGGGAEGSGQGRSFARLYIGHYCPRVVYWALSSLLVSKLSIN